MSKQKRKTYSLDKNTKTFPILPDGTILEQFEYFIKDHRKVSDIIDFLSVQNASLLAFSFNEIPEQKANEIIEFVDYFDDNFYDTVAPAIYANWGQDPFIFQLAEQLIHEREIAKSKAAYESMTDIQKQESITLRDTLFKIRHDKLIVMVSETDYYKFEIPGTINKASLAQVKEEVLYLCAIAIREKAGITVNVFKDDHTEVFGIYINPFSVWMPLTKEQIRHLSCTTPGGIELEPEDGVVYTEIQRELF